MASVKENQDRIIDDLLGSGPKRRVNMNALDESIKRGQEQQKQRTKDRAKAKMNFASFIAMAQSQQPCD